MRQIDDYSDDRHKAWCIHCGAWIENVDANKDHVPTKSLLSKELRRRGAARDRGQGAEDDYLPQVFVCKPCNSGFSPDETYLLCVLHAVTCGSLYPDPSIHPDAAKILRSNRDIVRSLKQMPDGQLLLIQDLKPFTLYPDMDRVGRVVIKNARGHAYYEIGEPMLEPPTSYWCRPIGTIPDRERESFEENGAGNLGVWPEVGSRMMSRLISGEDMVGGWVEVEKGRYRYALDWRDGITVRTVIWGYLATEVRWVT